VSRVKGSGVVMWLRGGKKEEKRRFGRLVLAGDTFDGDRRRRRRLLPVVGRAVTAVVVGVVVVVCGDEEGAVCVCEGELTSLGFEKLDLFYSAHPFFFYLAPLF